MRNNILKDVNLYSGIFFIRRIFISHFERKDQAVNRKKSIEQQLLVNI